MELGTLTSDDLIGKYGLVRSEVAEIRQLGDQTVQRSGSSLIVETREGFVDPPTAPEMIAVG